MKKKILFLALTLLISFSGWTQSTTTLDFRIINPRIIYDFNIAAGFIVCENLDFDLEVKADIDGSYLHALEIHLTTNMSALTDLDFNIAPGWTGYYSNITPNLANGNINLSIANSQSQNYPISLANRWTQIPTTWKPVGTFRLRILDASLVENCAWMPELMEGQQYEKYFGTTPGVRTYLGFTTEGTPIENLYLGRIYSAGTANWGWSQIGGTTAGTQYIDWTTAVNTSVWDMGTSPAEITATGCKALGLRIHTGAQLTINPGKDLTCTGDAEINGAGALKIASNASGTGAFIDNGTISYPNSGSATVERYLKACNVNLPTEGCWHYITPPITDALSGVFVGDWLQTWDEPSNSWSGYIVPLNQPLNVLQGYIVSRPTANNPVKSFTGTLNTNCGAKSMTNTATPGGEGYNLTGNPYPSPVDLESAAITWNNVDKKVWYYSKFGKTYKPWVVGGPQETNPGVRYAPSTQGFFVHVSSAGTGSLTIANGARTTSIDTIYYKNTTSTPDVLWLTAQGPTGMTDETVVYFRPDAGTNYDPSFDCQKMWGSDDALQLFTRTGDNRSVAINALNYTGISTIVPLDFTIFTPGASGNFTLTASKLESFRTGTQITLEDKKEQRTQELTVNPVYAFQYADGDNASRFLIHFNNPFFTTGGTLTGNNLLIYAYGQDVYVKNQDGTPLTGSLQLYTMLGQQITTREISNTTLSRNTFTLPSGYYIARMTTRENTRSVKLLLH